MSLRKEHWIMLILCTIALLWYQFGVPLINLKTIDQQTDTSTIK